MKIDPPIVLVSGSREFTDAFNLRAVLTELDPFAVIVGDAAGADCIARDWCKTQKLPYSVHKADWRLNGKAAGPLRNQAMVEDWRQAFPKAPHVAVFAWVSDAECRGTRDCFKRAKKYRSARVIHVGPVPADIARF